MKQAPKRPRKPAAKSAAKSTAGASTGKKEPRRKAGGTTIPPPDLPARIDGVRGWLDQIEHRQSRISYFGIAGLLIALATAAVALYLGIGAQQEKASRTGLDEVKAQVGRVQAEAAASLDNQVKALNGRINSLQLRLTVAEQQAQQAQQAAANKGGGSNPKRGR